MNNAFVRYGLSEATVSDRGPKFKPTRQVGEANHQWLAHRFGIKQLYSKKPQIKGKIEGPSRFIQRDFVLEHIQRTSIKDINEAFRQ